MIFYAKLKFQLKGCQVADLTTQWHGGTLLLWLITSKRFEIETWGWSHFEDILEENMLNFQNEGWRAPRGSHGGPKGPKMAKIDLNLEFLRFCHPFHSGG